MPIGGSKFTGWQGGLLRRRGGGGALPCAQAVMREL